MYVPLIQTLIDRQGYPVLGRHDLASFCAEHEWVVLFFAGDPARVAESHDVAVILPELIGHFSPRLTPAIVERTSEMELQAVYQFIALPTLVFLKRGAYVGMIPRMHSWPDYVRQTRDILAREPGHPPPFDLPAPCGRGSGGARGPAARNEGTTYA